MTGGLTLHWALGPRASAISLRIDFMVFFHLSKARVPCEGLHLLSRAYHEQEENVPLSRRQDDAASRDLCLGTHHFSHRHPSLPLRTHQLIQPQAKVAGNKQVDHVTVACPRSRQALKGSSPPQAWRHHICAAQCPSCWAWRGHKSPEATGVYISEQPEDGEEAYGRHCAHMHQIPRLYSIPNPGKQHLSLRSARQFYSQLAPLAHSSPSLLAASSGPSGSSHLSRITDFEVFSHVSSAKGFCSRGGDSRRSGCPGVRLLHRYGSATAVVRGAHGGDQASHEQRRGQQSNRAAWES